MEPVKEPVPYRKKILDLEDAIRSENKDDVTRICEELRAFDFENMPENDYYLYAKLHGDIRRITGSNDYLY